LALQHIGTDVRIGRNEIIFSQGDPATYAYKVTSGAVRLCRHMSDGRRHIAQFSFPGDFFSVMESEQHCFTAEAVTDVVLVRYLQVHLSALSDERPAVARRFVALLSQRLCEMQKHLTVLGCQSAKGRVASFLLSLAERVVLEKGNLVDAPMNRHDIADYLGLTNETVCRVLSEFRRARVIGTPNLRQFVLLNVCALQSLAGRQQHLAAA
jgi:CRP-like cAMP-binding protein